jgi:transcriptional regulator with XRE-family HTH domain
VVVVQPVPATLRRLREDRGLTQEALAKRAKIGFSYLSKIETGARTNVSEPVTKRLARALGVEPFVLRFSPDEATAHLAALAIYEKRDAAAESASPT